MYQRSILKAFLTLLLASSATADGLYSKNSAVLQVDGASYQKKIAKSNHVSIVEFYAPWCGHCQNLKPEYEKAAKSLRDFANVAAVNCDDEANKPFCGTMGVQGFPTLKIVKPGKKGKPIVEDYQGARTSSAIVESVKAAIPNHVKKVIDKELQTYLDNEKEMPKALLFSEKGTTSALIKVLAQEYLGKINFAQIRKNQAKAVETFEIEEFPTLLALPGGEEAAVKFDGEFKKATMKDFLNRYVSPVAQGKGDKQKPVGKKAEKNEKEEASKSSEASSSFTEASASQKSAEASEEAAGATSITLDDESQPTESPDPQPSPEAPKPIPVPNMPEPIPALLEESHLRERCLGEKTSTCVLALIPEVEGEEIVPEKASLALSNLAEIVDKHVKRETKLFPILSIPSMNAGSAILRDALRLGDKKTLELVAVNARRSWFRRYEKESYDFHAIEDWIDNIRFGEGAKGKLPAELLPKEEEEKPETPEHGEL